MLRLESDLEYIATWSPGRDLLIIGRTIVEVLRMRNAY
jgi:lipopolysaccharide/colanic/teichoic acid biosynthesis glycosyltransferase